ncbi:proline-rich protein 2-like [Microtus oregoni]|uniref:proline-rich protein 2-like n=1 Tax=Microtus oregoni TaxID=111838 RepID=UPI001BB1615A|nr:proline-rich protein 2-like [Microtus oregoni]
MRSEHSKPRRPSYGADSAEPPGGFRRSEVANHSAVPIAGDGSQVVVADRDQRPGKPGDRQARPAPGEKRSALPHGRPRPSSACGHSSRRKPLFLSAVRLGGSVRGANPRGRSPPGVTADFRSRSPTPPAGRQPQPRGRTRRECPQAGPPHTLNFGHRSGPQTSATRSRPPGRFSHGPGRAASTADLSFLKPSPAPAVHRPKGPGANPPGWRPSPRAPRLHAPTHIRNLAGPQST